MNDFESNLWGQINTLLGEINEIREKISNMSDPNVTINTNSTIILRIDQVRLSQELQILMADYSNHCEAELRSRTLPILADEEIFFENLHQ